MNQPQEQCVFQNIADLGTFVRNRRHEIGMANLQASTKKLPVGKRFLSELERGKETAQIGKVLRVLQGLGYNLAAVPRAPTCPELRSRKLDLDFPYDWSNPDMDEDVFIAKVLEKARFTDVLKIALHFGVDRVVSMSEELPETPVTPRIHQILTHIQDGSIKAKAHAAGADPC